MLWKDLRYVERVVVLTLWSCASLHPRALQWSCTQFLSWCLVCWAGSEQFASAQFQLRSRRQLGLDVYLSIWEDCALLGKLGSLSVTWELKLEMQRRKQHTLRFWRYVRILADDFSLRRFLANFSVCHKLLDLLFVIGETKAFILGKVVISKSASFFW